MQFNFAIRKPAIASPAIAIPTIASLIEIKFYKYLERKFLMKHVESNVQFQ